ncbi:ABC transporter substrate-binding protein [Falsirhodobacter sp. 20TX0035]|uniref:ABC transporter substrate-binding protein n=1 Tax=Falsirhodobacter sp. 20TX0035 TaxID=3022019 RepID=UPI00232BE994|nr:ABC transporter substrate-binding protein [Falsirhodobacter sp. 20TX0035]MDB6453415.1 ABC transporter substrate-binding protein [Falsirhodobacter sp. 20TX0035]
MHSIARRHLRDHQNGRLSRREFLTRVTALGVAAPLAYGMLGTGTVAAQAQPVAGGILRMQMPTLALCDPRLADWPEIGNMLRGWLEPLVTYHADGTFTGHLLERWETSEDGLNLRLHLRPGIRWQNGEAMVAEHVAHNLRRWCEPTPRNGLAAVMDAVARGEVKVVDDLTLDVTLGFADATLIASMSDYNALIVHPSYDGADPSVSPLGSGPYLPILNEVGKMQSLEKVSWWGTPVFGGPWLDRIDYVDLGTAPMRALEAARAGQIDAVDQTIADNIRGFQDLGWISSQTDSAATLAVRFQQKDRTFVDPRVRRALQLAVENAVVLDIGVNGLGMRGENHHVCPLHPDYARVDPPITDIPAAQALLAEAGLTGHTFTLTSLDDAWQALSCDAVAAQLNDAGIPTQRQILPGAEYWANWRTYPFSGTYWNMRPLGVQVLRLAYRSGSEWNETGFFNPAFDTTLDRALGIADATERQAAMQELETILREEAVLIQPFWRTLTRHATPRLRGAAILPTLAHRHHEWWLAP